MKVTKEELPQRETLLTIELEPEDLEPYLERAYRKVVQRTNIPGFRKGKAPRTVVEPFIGREALREEALEVLLPEVVDLTIEEQHLEPGGRPSVELVQTDPVMLKATVPLMPLVELDDYRAIRVDEEPVEITDEKVMEVLEQIRQDQAPWEPADRGVALGDQVVLDARGVKDGREILNQKGIVYFAVKGNPSPVPGFVEELVGLEAGQDKEFTLTIPQDYRDQELAGRECTFHVTVHEIKEKRPVELNDEFAKGVGEGYDSLEVLREKVRSDLQSQAEQEARRSYEDKVIQMVADQAKVEISSLLVEQEVDHLLADEEEALRRQQVGMDQYLQNVGKSAEDHREELRSAALPRLVRNYALRKVAELEGLEASPEDVEEELNSLVKGASAQADSVRRTFDTPEGKRSLSRMIVSRRTVERLTEIARGQQPDAAGPSTEEKSEQESGQGGAEHAEATG